MVIQVATLAGLEAAAAQFLAHIKSKTSPQKKISHRHFVFYGEMGVGKTTFIKAICQQLGITDEVSSPTYALINEYHSDATNNTLKAYHFDLYRLQNTREAVDIGIEEYLDDKTAYCFIEWPQVIEPLLDIDNIKVYLTLTAQQEREINIEF